MTRYLIRPSVRCENLASHVLGLCSRRVARDYEARYGVEPWLMETFVDRDQFAGTCFQAANWLCVGQTQGRGRNGSKKEGKDRDHLPSEAWLQGHREQTIRRLANEKVALIIQDTMDLNFSTRPHCENLGQIGTNQMGTKSKRLKMHSALALNTRGIPLGVLRVHPWAPEAADKNTHRNDLPIEEKDSYRWVQTYQDVVEVASRLTHTHLVCMGDRESDIFELFDERRKQGGRVDILARVQHNRCLQGEEEKLFECLRQGPAATEVSIVVPRQREKPGKPSKPGQPAMPARTAQVEVRFREVTLCAPKTSRLKNKQPITMFAVSLVEKHPPPGTASIQWLLLTTIEVRSIKQALRCARWYCLRWRIEEWHRILKSGCRILEHQNHTAEVLSRTITLDAVIAWRIMVLALLGRELPDLPCELLFNSWECSALQLLAQKKSP